MLLVTEINGNKIDTYNNFNEPNPYKLIMDVIDQLNWPIDMITFTSFPNGLIARLDRTATPIEKQEIIVQY